MYSQRGRSGPGGAFLLGVVAAAAVLILWMRVSADHVQISTWPGAGPMVQAGAMNNTIARQPAAGGLSGVAQAQQQSGQGLPGELRPAGNPLRAANTVMTQGYGVGTHAPAEIWGAIDLAIDGNGDGAADAEGTWNQPIYATHYGVVKTTPNSHPAGNHVWVTNDQYRTGFAHLSSFAVSDGQVVEKGDLIGYIGSTGMSSGPHLDYQVWVKQGGTWVNVNPLDYQALDLTP